VPDGAAEPGFEAAPEEQRRTHLETSPVDQLVSEGRAADDRPLDIDASTLDRDRDTGDGARAELCRKLWRCWAVVAGVKALISTSAAAPRKRWPSIFMPRSVPVTSDRSLLFAARWLIDQIDEAGYLVVGLEETGSALGLPLATRDRGPRARPVARPDRGWRTHAFGMSGAAGARGGSL